MGKKEKKIYLEYKEKPLVRRGDTIYYGNPSDPYIIMFSINSKTKNKDMEIANAVSIFLMTNTGKEKEKIIKKADRDGLFNAMDIGEFWLEDALEQSKK